MKRGARYDLEPAGELKRRRVVTCGLCCIPPAMCTNCSEGASASTSAPDVLVRCPHVPTVLPNPVLPGSLLMNKAKFVVRDKQAP